MKTILSIVALAAALLFSGCEAYVVDHGRPYRTYGYHGHRYYHGDHYSHRRYGYTRPYSGYRRGYYRPSATVVVGRPHVYGRVWR